MQKGRWLIQVRRRDGQRDDGLHSRVIRVVLARQNAMALGLHAMSAWIWSSSADTPNDPGAHRCQGQQPRIKSEEAPL